MHNVRLIVVGRLKEGYLREAAAEYKKRLGAFCSFSTVEIKEAKLPDNPSASQIEAAIEDEGRRIAGAIPPRAYTIALAIEGIQLSSEELAVKIKDAAAISGCLCFIIGGSNGLSQSIKNASSLSLSLSRLTFPHQLARVLLLEVLYRSFNVIKGTKYHK